jgi:hypothetical protein
MSKLILLLLFLLCIPLEGFSFLPKHKTEKIIGSERINHNSNWYYLADNDDARIMILFKLLAKSQVGQNLIKRAKKKAYQEGITLLDLVSPGQVSITDTTLVRKFSPERPDIMAFSTKSKVFIDKQHSVLDATLDLAHELTHYIDRSIFNPYDSKFNLQGFIVSIIEGKGGEVDAYLVECQVLKSLFPKYSKNSSKCSLISSLDGNYLDRDLTVRYFYRMGRHLDGFVDKLVGYEIPVTTFNNLTNQQSLFISSAYGIPYPLAAIKEYEQIMKKVCDNDSKRLDMAKDTIRRTLASVQKTKNNFKETSLGQMRKSYKKRCDKH